MSPRSLLLWSPLLLVLSVFGSLQAEEKKDLFSEGRLFAELGGSSPTIGPRSAFVNDASIVFSSLLLYNNAVGSTPKPEQANLALLGLVVGLKAPTVSGANKRFGFEYAFNEYLGLGGAVSETIVSVKGSNYAREYADILGLLPLVFQTSGTTTNPAAYLPFIPLSYEMEPLHTVDFDIGFHIPAGSFDPFVRVTAGGGAVTGGSVSKLGLALGTRWNPFGNAVISLEGFYSTFSFSSGDITVNDAVFEYGARFSAGFFLEAP